MKDDGLGKRPAFRGCPVPFRRRGGNARWAGRCRRRASCRAACGADHAACPAPSNVRAEGQTPKAMTKPIAGRIIDVDAWRDWSDNCCLSDGFLRLGANTGQNRSQRQKADRSFHGVSSRGRSPACSSRLGLLGDWMPRRSDCSNEEKRHLPAVGRRRANRMRTSCPVKHSRMPCGGPGLAPAIVQYRR